MSKGRCGGDTRAPPGVYEIGPFTASCVTCGKPMPLRRRGSPGTPTLRPVCSGSCRWRSQYATLGEVPEFLTGPFTAECVICGKPMPLRRIGDTGPISLRPSCRGRCREKARGPWRKQYETERTWRRHYGMTADDYAALLAAQGGGCAICGARSPGVRVKHFHVDHDHDTGQIRGLLCHHCNLGIGCFFDSPSRLQRALRYVRGHAPALRFVPHPAA